MNTRNSFKTGLGLLVTLVPLTLFSGPAGASVADTVCAPTRDVNSVMGNGPVAVPSVSCQVERKVMAIAGSQDVSTIHGNGPRYINVENRPDSVVARRNLKGNPVELVMGRSGDPIPAAAHRIEQGIAAAPKE